MIKRVYECSECHKNFEARTVMPLPKNKRVCQECVRTVPVFKFVDRVTGKTLSVRAGDVELATLRAWAINPNLTFNVPK